MPESIPATTQKGLSFTLEQSPDLPRNITVDSGKLRQVLINLIGNAIKFTESGGVCLRAEVAKEEPAAATEEGELDVAQLKKIPTDLIEKLREAAVPSDDQRS